MYLGADRESAATYGKFYEVPPGVLQMFQGSDDVVAKRFAGLQQLQRLPANKTKLLAYIADNCTREGEFFFDTAVEMLKGLGTIEALGKCHGSHPELVPRTCGGGDCRILKLHKQGDTVALEKALEPFKFVMVFEQSAVRFTQEPQQRCPAHLNDLVYHSLLVGSIPVVHAPSYTYSAANPSAIVFAKSQHPRMYEGIHRLYKAATDDVYATQLMTAPPVPDETRERWFAYSTGYDPIPRGFASGAIETLAPLLTGAPSWRCGVQTKSLQPLGGAVCPGSADLYSDAVCE